MGRKSKKKKKKKKSPAATSSVKPALPATDPEALEAPHAVAGTVAWLLSAFATFLALIASASTWMIYVRNAEVETFGGVHLFLFAATVTGICTLVLTPLVLRARRLPPPKNITRGAIGIGLLPIAIQCLSALFGG